MCNNLKINSSLIWWVINYYVTYGKMKGLFIIKYECRLSSTDSWWYICLPRTIYFIITRVGTAFYFWSPHCVIIRNWHFIWIPMNCLTVYQILHVLLQLAVSAIVSFSNRVHGRNLESTETHDLARSQFRHYQGLHIGGCCCWFCGISSGDFLVESTPLPGTVIRSPVMGLAKSWMLGVEDRTGCGDRNGVTGLDPGDADDSDTGGE